MRHALHPVIAGLYAALILGSVAAMPARAEVPVVTDSRIKTFVYNANEVFNITTHYGYQSNIEFGSDESVETVSVGDRVAWQIIPAGRRLFLRAQEENAHTNMTVVTNIRAYQFDLRSSSADAVFGSEELTYVVRFYYPGEGAPAMAASYAPTPAMPMATAPMVAPMQAPVAIAPLAAPAPYPSAVPSNTPAMAAAPYNYRYSFSGPNDAAPVKIYDDGRSTFFKFRGDGAPRFSVVSPTGQEMSVQARKVQPNLYVVDRVAPRFLLRSYGKQVIVYNEASGA